jgi:hypothetical protein
MGSYLAGPTNPSLLREYDRKRSQQAQESGDAPKRRPDETESEFADRVRRYQTVAAALDRL